MRHYTLKVKFDDPGEETLTKIFLHFSRDYFNYRYWKGIAPPNKVEFEFVALSDAGLELLKGRFREWNLSGGNFTIIETYG